MTATLVERLSRLDTCAVSDALDRLGKSGLAAGLTPLSGSRLVVGEAITVQLGLVDGTASPRHLCTAAVDASGPGKVIVIAHGARTDVAGWGGILSLGAVTRGAEGVVIDGACRDLDETRQYGLPLWGRNAVPTTARGRIREVAWNEPVTLCGVPVAPGDLVIADASGVLFIARADAAEVVATAETIARRERLIADAVRGGRSMAEAMGANYETMLTEHTGVSVNEGRETV
ncbi:dimethylmenaquinone methyltransferase [Azospirillum palustre]|uniref:Putative 4-hydroxy-4-methyl-2-oxoglutarate aldolase n=1 Tax=Azospirillum palustre TaxID=2044885 RepID=A0A2B8B8F6_9PROT|nr:MULTISPECIES: dimethylmenaquinone methyltransferase [Azospirillum]MDR6775577.1 regulator of RNase E activity RraA [Azospirillum sp. BE72]PGH54211.1 dimethylmenaquinone methyltransferase [Azospirillum palustre]